jgi:hypothetical protein
MKNLARQYNKKAKTTADVPVSNVDASTSTSSVDLGWKELQSKPPKKKKQKQQAMQDRQEADVEEVNLDKERSQLAEVCPGPRFALHPCSSILGTPQPTLERALCASDA